MLNEFIEYLKAQIGQPYLWGGQHTKLTPENYKVLSIGTTRVVNCGACLNYGGYAVDGGYRPQPMVEYKIHLSGTRKETWVEER